MLKLAKLTDYATVLMTALASEPAHRASAQELAERSHLPIATASKLLKLLAKARLVEASRGVHGGYRLTRSPAQITVADVIDAIEGPIAVTECSLHVGGCSIESNCGTRANWRLINTAIRGALEAVTLAQMATPQRRSVNEAPLTFHPRSVPSQPPASD